MRRVQCAEAASVVEGKPLRRQVKRSPVQQALLEAAVAALPLCGCMVTCGTCIPKYCITITPMCCSSMGHLCSSTAALHHHTLLRLLCYTALTVPPTSPTNPPCPMLCGGPRQRKKQNALCCAAVHAALPQTSPSSTDQLVYTSIQAQLTYCCALLCCVRSSTDLHNFMAIWEFAWGMKPAVNIPESETNATVVMQLTGMWGLPTDNTAAMFGGPQFAQEARGPLAIPAPTLRDLMRLQSLFDRAEDPKCCKGACSATP